MSPYYSEGYWEEYYEKSSERQPLIGLVIDIRIGYGQGMYSDGLSHKTYKVVWLNIEPNDYMMNRYFFGDELRLLSKINHNQEGEEE